MGDGAEETAIAGIRPAPCDLKPECCCGVVELEGRVESPLLSMVVLLGGDSLVLFVVLRASTSETVSHLGIRSTTKMFGRRSRSCCHSIDKRVTEVSQGGGGSGQEGGAV